MSGSSRLFRNIASNWVGLLLNLAVSFFLAPFVVNSLGSTWYGIWAIAGQFTGYLYLLDFGVRESVIKYTARYAAQQRSEKLNRILTTAFLLYTPIFVLCVLASIGGAWGFSSWFDVDPAHAETAGLVVLLVGLTIAQTFVFNVFTGILQGLHRFDIANLFGVVLTLVRAGLIVLALSFGYGIVALSLIQLLLALVGGCFTAVAALVYLKRAGLQFRIVRLSRRRFLALSRRVFGYSVFVFVNNIGQKTIVASGALIIGIFMPIASVTYYAIAASLIDYVRGLVTATAQVFNPLTSHYVALRQNEMVRQVLVRGSKLTLFIGLPAITAYLFMGQRFIGLWMGKEFAAQAGEVLFVLAIAALFSCPHHTVSSVLYGMSRHHVIAYLRVGEAIVNVALSLALVQTMGLVGVAWGQTIPHVIVVTLILPAVVCRMIGLPLRTFFVGAYAGPIASAIPFALGAYYLNAEFPAQNLPVFFGQIGLLLIVYLAAGYWLALTREEQALAMQYARRLLGLPRARHAQ